MTFQHAINIVKLFETYYPYSYTKFSKSDKYCTLYGIS